ncbi:MAG: ATP-binding protein, partial [bacterium]
MDSERLNEALSDQQEIFYRKEELVDRDVDLDRFLNLKHIVVITGIRRSGKSTLLKLFSRKRIGCYVRFDDVRLTALKPEDFEKIEMFALKRYGSNPVFYLDEMQGVELWEKWVNDLHNKGYKVFVTGSNARLLGSEYATYLTGRHIPLNIMQFSFQETLRYKQINTSRFDVQNKSRILGCFDSMLNQGSFPEVVITGYPGLASQYYTDIVEKDIILRHDLRLKKDVFQFGLFALSNAAKILSYSKIKSVVGMKSLETVKSYLDAFTESFVLHTISRFDYS